MSKAPLLALGLILATISYAEDNKAPHGSIKQLGGQVLIDARTEVTQSTQFDKQLDLVGISTPTATVRSNHANLWLNNSAKQLCTQFDNGSTGCLATGSAAGTITGVTAGNGLTGGGTSGSVSLAVNYSSVTAQGNVFNNANQLVQLDGSTKLPAINASNLTSLTASALTGLVPNTSIDSSSITKQGNLFNGNSQLIQLDSSSRIPALNGSLITNLTAPNLSGLVPNTSIDSSSVTKQGNVFNGNSQLVQTTSGGLLPALSGVNLTNLNASNLASGTVPNARLDNTSVTLQGNNFNGASQLVKLDATSKLPAVNGSQLTSLPAGIGAIKQWVDTMTITANSTTGNTYVSTNLAYAFTPLSASSTIYIVVTHPIRVNNSGQSGGGIVDVRMVRGATTIRTWDQAVVIRDNPAETTSLYEYIDTFIAKDNYNSTSTVTYTTDFRTNAGGSTALIDNTATNPSIMWIIEVGG